MFVSVYVMVIQGQKVIDIYTEQEVRLHLSVNKTYRPSEISIVLIKEGRIDVNYNLRQYSISSPSILVINPNYTYEFGDISPDFKIRVISFVPNFELMPAIKIKLCDVHSFFISTVQNHYSVELYEFKELWNCLELLNNKLPYWGTDSTKKEIFNHLFLSFMYLVVDIIAKYDQTKIDELNRVDLLTNHFVRLVAYHFRTKRKLSFYADQLGISTKHLSETVKSCSGYTAGEVIDQVVLMEAKILLANQLFSINQVAQELNFSDQYAFSKFFKRLTKLAPTDYKRVY